MNLLLAADPTKFFGTNHIILLCISVVLIIGLSIVIAKTNINGIAGAALRPRPDFFLCFLFFFD